MAVISARNSFWLSLFNRENRGSVSPHLGGTVPLFKMQPRGPHIFTRFSCLSMNLDDKAKIYDRLLHPYPNLSVLSLITLPSSNFGLNCMVKIQCILSTVCSLKTLGLANNFAMSKKNIKTYVC